MFIGKWDVERKEDFLYEGSCRIHKVDGISVWFFGVLYNKKTLGYDPAANEAKIIIEIYREKGYTGFARLDGSFTCLLRTPDSAVIFRDHHGTSYQVYYTSQYFSSSLMRLKDMDGFTAVPNYKALSSFLSIGYIETPMCAFVDGFRAGMNYVDNKEQFQKTNNMKSIALFPDNFANLKDSVYNEKTGEFVPAIYGKLVVSVNTPVNIWLKFITMMCNFIGIFTMIFSVVFFAKLIIAINKSRIFDWKNVRRLRWLGAILILNFICSAFPAYISAYELSGVFSISGYSVNLSGLVSKLTLVLGLVALIVGEVFAIGLKMKEEQDLTI